MTDRPRTSWLLPEAIREDQKVAVFAPSAPGMHRFRERFQRGVEELEKTLQRKVVVPENVEVPGCPQLAGPPHTRAECFNQLMADPSIGAIFTTYGGFNTNEILKLIDWDTARSNPKCVVGYSDTTALLLALTEKARLTTYYGPAVLPQFGEVGGMLRFTSDELRATLIDGSPRRIPTLSYWYDQVLDWAEADDKREPIKGVSTQSAVPGQAEGLLFGGNLDTINYLIGTDYLRPPTEDSILFLEMVDAAARWQAFRRSLVHLRDAGYLKKVTGIMVGRSPQTGSLEDLARIFIELLPDPTIPIILNAPFGHFDPITTLPIGVATRIKSTADACTIEILGRSVR